MVCMVEDPGNIQGPERKGLSTATTQLGVTAAGFLGLFTQPFYLLGLCAALMFFGEAIRVSLRSRDGIPFSLLPGLLFGCAVYALIAYGLGWGFGWVCRYFGWL